MKILLTGASGFIGSSFMDKYSNQTGLEIIGIGRRGMNLSNYIQCDITQPIQLDYQPDAVIHSAAKSSPWGTKEEFYKQNVEATKNVIHFCIQKNVQKLIYISSSSVYYNTDDQYNLSEISPIGQKFINEYARTKYLGELCVQEFPNQWTILRPRAVFGPRDTVLFPRILDAARKKTLPIIEREKKAIGDLIYIENLIDYMFQAATNKNVVGIYNLTNNEPVEIESFLFSIFERLRLPLPTFRISYKNALIGASLIEGLYQILPILGEPPITEFGIHVFALSKTFDVTKSIQVMGHPKINIETGVNRFIEWYQKSQK